MPTHNNIPNIPTEVDVLIVGLGPVGSALGLQLAKAASKPKVLAIERFPDPYPLPRAVSLDGEGTRIVDFTAGIEGIGEKEEVGLLVWKYRLLITSKIPADLIRPDHFSLTFLRRVNTSG